MTLTGFLLARIAEDEAVAESLRQASMGDPWGWQPHGHPLTATQGRQVAATPARILAECEAKRRIVERDADAENAANYFTDDRAYGGWRDCHEFTLRILALPYATHPDYREEWRP